MGVEAIHHLIHTGPQSLGMRLRQRAGQKTAAAQMGRRLN